MGLADFIIDRVSKREPNLYIGGKEDPYLIRWYIIPRNPIFNIYLHKFIRDDDDRAAHDHPWLSLSWLMRGILIEKMPVRIGMLAAWNIRTIMQGQWTLRSAKMAHRLEVPEHLRGKTWTLFLTGPKLREWGFHCPKGWVHWLEFTGGARGETIGKGCGE